MIRYWLLCLNQCSYYGGVGVMTAIVFAALFLYLTVCSGARGSPGQAVDTPLGTDRVPFVGLSDPLRGLHLSASGQNRSKDEPQDWFVDWYGRLLDRIIDKLDNWTTALEDPSQDDLDKIACANGFNSFARHLTSGWAMNMIDSSSKLQSGLLTGNLNDMGQFDECVKAQSQIDPSDPFTADFTGQHCLISFNFHVPNNTIVLNGQSNRLMDLFGADWIPLTLAQCYPSLCKPRHIEELLNAALDGPDYILSVFGLDYRVDVTIASTDCHVEGHGSPDTLDWVVAAIILFFLLLGGICTSIDYFYISRETRMRQTTAVEEILLAFSLYTNGGKLLETNQAPNSMSALNGLKFFSISWVVLGHRFRYLINQPLINLLDFPDELKRWSKMILLSGPLSVDTFFLISGLLNMYVFCMIREKKPRYTPIETAVAYLHRYLRLTPAYLVMIGLTATWVYRTGDGPYWDRIVGDGREDCRNNYWMNLVYLNNYLEPDNYCMMQSWYLAADMQMFWLSPLVIFPLWKWPVIGFILIAILVIASILSPLLISYIFQIKSPIPLTTDAVQASHEMAYLYLPTHTKTVTYVLGILAGYYVYKIKRDKIRFRPNKVTQLFFWLASAAFMLFAMFGGYTLYQRDTDYNRLYSAFFIGFYRFFWGIGLIWIIFACITGHAGPINTLLSWPALAPLARLTYCVYLTHIAVIMRGVASARSPVYYSDYHEVEGYLGDLVLSFIAAAILSLFFESPMMKIEKLLFEGGFKKKPVPKAPPREPEHSA